MSDTLDRLKSIFIEQLGARALAIDLDSSLESTGLDGTDREVLTNLIERNFKLILSAIEVEHHQIDVDGRVHDLEDLTPRQLAGWIDGWINRDDIHPPFHGRHIKPL